MAFCAWSFTFSVMILRFVHVMYVSVHNYHFNVLIHFSSVQSLSRVRLCDPIDCSTPAFLSITNSRGLLKLMSIELVMPSNHLILCRPLLLHLQSFLASGSFQMSQFFASGGQSIGVSASASVLPMNIQD